MTAEFFTAMMLIILSPAIGSFISVLVDRLPRGESPILPRSRCRTCQTPLTALDLVPLLSFLLLKGKCRHCGTPIPPWHLYVEITAIGLAVIAVLAGQTPAEIWLGACLLWLLLALAVTDLLSFILPDVLTAALSLCSIALVLIDPWRSWESAALGAMIGSGGFLILRQTYYWRRNREGLGLGDVKLMVGLGALLGPYHLPLMLLLAASGSLIFALLPMVRKGKAPQATLPLPFGTALCCASALVWLWNG